MQHKVTIKKEKGSQSTDPFVGSGVWDAPILNPPPLGDFFSPIPKKRHILMVFSHFWAKLGIFEISPNPGPNLGFGILTQVQKLDFVVAEFLTKKSVIFWSKKNLDFCFTKTFVTFTVNFIFILFCKPSFDMLNNVWFFKKVPCGKFKYYVIIFEVGEYFWWAQHADVMLTKWVGLLFFQREVGSCVNFGCWQMLTLGWVGTGWV